MLASELATSRQAQRWLENFTPDDQPTALLLLNNIRIVSETSLVARLTQSLHVLAASRVQPIALYPVRSVPDDDPAYIEPQPDRPYESSAGSEHVVANLLRNAVRGRAPGTAVYQLLDLDALRTRRVRTLLMVDDYAGSGQKALSYLAAWRRNRTLRSWRSYKKIRFEYLAFCVSSTASRALSSARAFDAVHYVEFGRDFASARWTDQERRNVERICVDYAWKKDQALGWNSSAGLFIPGTTVPNNLPAVLRQAKGPNGRNWTALFPERQLTPDLQLSVSDQLPVGDHADMIQSMGWSVLARALRAGDLPPARRLLLVVLATLTRGPKDVAYIARRHGIPVHVVNDSLTAALELGLIDNSNHLTDAGWEELKSPTRLRRQWEPTLTGSDEPYYPRALRRPVHI